MHSLVARYSSSNDYHRMRKISLISSILLRFLRFFFFALVFLLFLLHEYLVKPSLMHGISVWWWIKYTYVEIRLNELLIEFDRG